MFIDLLNIRKLYGEEFFLCRLGMERKYFFFGFAGRSDWQKRHETISFKFSLSVGQIAEYRFATGIEIKLFGKRWKWRKKKK